MRHLVIVLAASGCVSAEPPLLFQDASVGAASTNSAYLNRPIRVCGQVLADYRGPRGEWVLSRRDTYSMSWLVVDASAGPLQPGAETCLRGVVRLHDDVAGMEHGPDYRHVLYRCSDVPSCHRAGRGARP
jgi:hypothetical protein